jgi:phospho-N-acetylmuramoyl-pentapeptide-transferase
MLYLLIRDYFDALDAAGFGFLRVFTATTFQAAAAAFFAFLTCLLLGRPTIAWLRRQKIGDNPEFDQATLNELMAGKRGTPTMGGVLIVFAIAAAVLLLANLENFYVQMSLVCLVWLGAVGAVDDWLKLTAARRGGGRMGLSGREKLGFQFGLALLLALFTWRYGRNIPEVTTVYVPFFKDFAVQLHELGFFGPMIFVGIAAVVIVGTSNAVNLTDGLDGLAAGVGAIAAFAFMVLALVIGDREAAVALLFHNIPAAGEMAIPAAAMVGACLGFLWYNCLPARVFMGDTGSLALGGLLGYIAIVLRQELMLLIVGGVFVAEAVSVMIQVGYFKYTRRRTGTGRRVFLMAPLHHHFQRKGWAESQVVVRFWLVAAMLAAVAVATVKVR